MISAPDPDSVLWWLGVVAVVWACFGIVMAFLLVCVWLWRWKG